MFKRGCSQRAGYTIGRCCGCRCTYILNFVTHCQASKHICHCYGYPNEKETPSTSTYFIPYCTNSRRSDKSKSKLHVNLIIYSTLKLTYSNNDIEYSIEVNVEKIYYIYFNFDCKDFVPRF